MIAVRRLAGIVAIAAAVAAGLGAGAYMLAARAVETAVVDALGPSATLGAVRRGWVLPRRGGSTAQSRVQRDGEFIASLLQGRITAWLPAAPPRLTAVPEPAQRVTHFDWSPSGDELAVARGDRLTLEAVDGSDVRAEWVFPELLRALTFGPPGSD